MVDIPTGKNVQNGKEIMGFSPSGPPKGSGPHRYIFLLFGQDSKIGNNASSGVEERKGFKIKGYVDKNKIGSLKAANFYYTENK